MRSLGKERASALALGVLTLLAVIGWIAARQIRSPARIAAETAAPAPSPITVPIVRRSLSAEVIVRGTVRFGAPQGAVLGTSEVKQAAGASDIVTRPPIVNARLRPGSLAMAVDGRPVFVLPGSTPMHRDLHRGDRGPDVGQLEQELARLGFPPGPVDGTFDAATAAAVSAFYISHGWDPFGPTTQQVDQLVTAEAAAAAARDAHLQAVNNTAQALLPVNPGDLEQARIDVNSARDAIHTAQLDVVTARSRLVSAKALAASTPSAEAVATAESRRDQAAADADVAAKRADLQTAVDEERLARLRVQEVAPGAAPSEQEAAVAAVRQAGAAVTRAQADLAASIAAADAVRAAAGPAVLKARADAAQAAADVPVAAGELHRAQLAVRTARRSVTLTEARVATLAADPDTSTLRAIASAAAEEERRTRAEVNRLAVESGVQVPANEVLFFSSLPVRVTTVTARRGNPVSGSVMKVSRSGLAIDSSLSVSDAKLVRRGDPVRIEEQDLGITTSGRVTGVANTPGTNRVDPGRFYLAVKPRGGSASLVGASVKLTIAVRSTRGRVLAVPPSALFVGGDGNARIRVKRGRQTPVVRVVPGLAAEGLVEVRPVGTDSLRPGDLVIVGSRRDAGATPLRGGGRGP